MRSPRAARDRSVAEEQDEIVITKDHRLVGCRGRVLVAVLVVTVLLLVLLAFLLLSLLSGTQPTPQPVRRASVSDAHAVAVATLLLLEGQEPSAGSA